MAESYHTIQDYIVAQETAYKQPIPINESWNWSMYDHIRLTTLYKNSRIQKQTDFTPVKNITRPILNLQYRAEGFDVKDITIFVNDSKNFFKSFLVRKFHEKWARENGIDTVIDSMVESYVDFGGALLKNVNDVKPEVVPLQSLAFCDQTDILSGPIAIKHFYSPDQLLDMASKGWGDPKNGATASLEEVVLLSREYKTDTTPAKRKSKTPGKYIEVYEVHGNMPNSFLDENDESLKYTTQIQIVCFYQKKNSDEKGFITLYKSKEIKSPFKFISRDPIYGRALGMGGAEELFEAQVWTNYNEIRMLNMLDAASTIILQTQDPAAARNKVKEMENLQIMEMAPNTRIEQVDTFPRSFGLSEKLINEWEIHAQQMGAASDAAQGKAPASGTSGALQELVLNESHSLHDYRRGKIATFWDEVERDWIMPYLSREIQKEQEFLAELDLEELQFVAKALVQCEQEDMKKKFVLDNFGIAPTQQQVDEFNAKVQDQFKAKGNKHFVKILKNEMKDVPITVRTDVAGKQKDLANRVAKLTNIFRTIISNPYILQSPPIAKLFNKIIEASGLEPIDLSGFQVPVQPSRRVTEHIDYKDLQPADQKSMLEVAGIDTEQGQLIMNPGGTPQEAAQGANY